MSTQYYDAIPVDVVTEVRRAAALLKTGALSERDFQQRELLQHRHRRKGRHSAL
jgi:hypothetical protein